MTSPHPTAIGLGTMGMSDMYGPADETESVATIHAALDAGVTLLDTGDFYGSGHNELLIARALRERDRDAVTLSVKFGGLRAPGGGFVGFDARPAAVKNALAQTLVRLGTDHVDVYRPARLDPQVPIEETMGAVHELVEAGYVRSAGLSEVGAETIRRAAAVTPIADLQIEWSLMARGVEDEILPVCRELGIGITAYGVLSRGILSGHWRPDRAIGAGEFRARSPRFAPENLQRNLDLAERLRAVAEEAGTTMAALAVAWVGAQGEDVLPLVGARTRAQLEESLGATRLVPDADLLARAEAAVPAGEAAGDRYDAHGMAQLDSERRVPA